jgi:SAM-dependent methyltransferase
LLDIGSGSGEFVYAAKLSGFDALGIEPHVGYSNYSKKTFNIDVRNWRFQNAEFDEQSFDIITIHHVLEHLQNPLNSLIEISKWLKFEGLLIVDVPDIETSMHSPINRFHYAHIYNFNHQTLRAILTKAGFELLEHRSNHSGTVLAAKKINQANVNLNIAMPDNYEKLWQILTKKEQALNYRKKTKIKRFFSKCWRYPKEFLQAAISADNKKIVEKQLKS